MIVLPSRRWMMLCLCLMGISAVGARAEESAAPPAARAWFFTPKLGLSGLTGILGLEVQYKHIGFDVGYPASGGVRYYLHPDRHSWFIGLFGQGFGYDNDETKDGIPYTHYAKRQGGIGAGYRWFWHERWSLELGLTVGAGTQRWSNDTATRTEHDIFFGPLGTVGVSF